MGDDDKLVKVDNAIGNTLAQGFVQNLPDIIGSLREAYRIHKKDGMFSKILQTKVIELQLSKENLGLFVSALNDLSRDKEADTETKTMYRDMIREIHNEFMKNSRDYSSLSDVLDKL